MKLLRGGLVFLKCVLNFWRCLPSAAPNCILQERRDSMYNRKAVRNGVLPLHSMHVRSVTISLLDVQLLKQVIELVRADVIMWCSEDCKPLNGIFTQTVLSGTSSIRNYMMACVLCFFCITIAIRSRWRFWRRSGISAQVKLKNIFERLILTLRTIALNNLIYFPYKSPE